MRVHAPAVAEQVPVIRRAVVESAEAHGAGPDLRADIALAVTEACTNVVLHAYLDVAPPGPLMVETHGKDGEFVVTVSDEGSGIIPRAHSSGLGIGLAVMSRLTQRLEITNHVPAGVRVTMAFVTAMPIAPAPTGP
jgi:anti-sigma regulatory factor (Ser/Thr protein kinase)